jgi:hypothetical protein
MLTSNTIDAVYVATPRPSERKLCLAAAANGKHVLGEKPFANLPSLRRITSACRKHGVGFMDGTHFVQSPENGADQGTMREKLVSPWTIDSAFQFTLPNADNISPGSRSSSHMAQLAMQVGYNMRAAVEYTAPGVKIVGVGRLRSARQEKQRRRHRQRRHRIQ